MIPIVTPDEMAAIDAAATEPVDELIERAGAAVARHAIALLGGVYGRSVAVVVGRGNNGNDGREAARRLRVAGRFLDTMLVGSDRELASAFGWPRAAAGAVLGALVGRGEAVLEAGAYGPAGSAGTRPGGSA